LKYTNRKKLLLVFGWSCHQLWCPPDGWFFVCSVSKNGLINFQSAWFWHDQINKEERCGRVRGLPDTHYLAKEGKSA